MYYRDNNQKRIVDLALKNDLKNIIKKNLGNKTVEFLRIDVRK